MSLENYGTEDDAREFFANRPVFDTAELARVRPEAERIIDKMMEADRQKAIDDAWVETALTLLYGPRR